MKKRAKKAFLSVFLIGSVGLLSCWMLIHTGYLRFNYPSKKKYPVRGIDVSHHQKEIDWQLVKKEKIRFAFIKATEGGDFKDTMFMINWQNAQAAGIDVGAYHFFTFCKSGKTQAQNFIETVPVNKTSLPPVIDLEFGGNCKLRKTDNEIISELDTLEKMLYEKYKKRPVFYVTREFYEHFLIDRFPFNYIWIRDIYNTPKLKDKRNWHFWQFANRGHLNGITTYVDLNVFYGNIKEYEQFKIGAKSVN